MKRYNISRIGLITSLLITLGGCNHFLEEKPDTRVELNNVEKAAQLLTNAYSNASYSFTEWMSDDVSTFTLGTQKLVEQNQMFKWDDPTSVNQDTPAYFWQATYDAIAHANEVLAVIDQMPGDEGRKNAVKAEALLTRAYGHFMLVNLFGKHYNDQTSDDDLGVPYVKTPEKQFIKKYDRPSVDDVYDDVEDDLLAGLELVNDTYYANSGKYHFTRNAALAFASRFYLFKGEYQECIDYSTELLGSNPDQFVKDIPALLRQRVNEQDYIRLYHAPSDASNILLIRQVSNFHIPSLGYWPSSVQYGQIFRSNPWNLTDQRENPAWIAGSTNGGGLAATKFEFLFERSSLTSNVGLNYTIALGFRGEEVLLNRAEAYIYRNRISSAYADLQLLANKRYDGAAPVNATTLKIYGSNERVNALQYCIDERQKEFMHEGLRWFDIKRYGIIVRHTLDDGTVIRLNDDDDRQVLQIPQAAIDVGGLKPNPR